MTETVGAGLKYLKANAVPELIQVRMRSSGEILDSICDLHRNSEATTPEAQLMHYR